MDRLLYSVAIRGPHDSASARAERDSIRARRPLDECRALSTSPPSAARRSARRLDRRLASMLELHVATEILRERLESARPAAGAGRFRMTRSAVLPLHDDAQLVASSRAPLSVAIPMTRAPRTSRSIGRRRGPPMDAAGGAHSHRASRPRNGSGCRHVPDHAHYTGGVAAPAAVSEHVQRPYRIRFAILRVRQMRVRDRDW